MKKSVSQARYLIDIVKKAIDLKVFVEREGPAVLRQEGNNYWVGLCPLHKDGAPSFSITHCDDGVWIYHCFGCSSGGTIIDFCMEQNGISNAYEAAVFAAQKEGIKCDASLIVKAAREAKVKTDEQNDINLAHFVACESCRRLLRLAENDSQIMSWVAKTFFAMNKILENPNAKADMFRHYREETFKKIGEICTLK